MSFSDPKERYFDNAATTPLHPIVLAEMTPYLVDDFGNANSTHSFGQRAQSAVRTARRRVASLLGCAPEEITFTSGATESNNWILQSFQSVAVSPFEHSSIREQACQLGFSFLDSDGYQVELPEEIVDLVSVMHVNNETGAIVQLPPALPVGTKVHRDMTQTFGKATFNLEGVDFASMSAHKLYGPKGVGALYSRDAQKIEPLLYGGEQEYGRRAGTLNVPGIVGFGAACAYVQEHCAEMSDHARTLRSAVLSTLEKVPDWLENTFEANSPHILSVSFLGIEGESLLIEADTKGFAISSGSACHSQSSGSSYVLKALGMEPEWTRGTVRISFSSWNTPESAEALGLVLRESVTKLRSMGK